jgi:hypothetical protein
MAAKPSFLAETFPASTGMEIFTRKRLLFCSWSRMGFCSKCTGAITRSPGMNRKALPIRSGYDILLSTSQADHQAPLPDEQEQEPKEDTVKFLATWSIQGTNVQAAQQRFVQKGGQYGEGVRLLGQWHSVNGVHGWSVVEAESALALTTWLDAWADLLEISITPVIEATEAGGFLTNKFKQS